MLFLAPFLPGVFVLLSCWYKRTELPVRVAILYGGNMIATAFSGLIAAGSKSDTHQNILPHVYNILIVTSRMEGKAGRPSWVRHPPSNLPNQHADSPHRNGSS